MAPGKKSKSLKKKAEDKAAVATAVVADKVASARAAAKTKKAALKVAAAETAAAARTAAKSKKAAIKVVAVKRAAAANAVAKDKKAAAKRKAEGLKKAAKKAQRKARSRKSDVYYANPSLFAPFSEGERADALRVLTEDKRLANMAKVGRYRTIAVEPLPVKPPHPAAGHRLGRIVAFDYAANKSVEATVDLDDSAVVDLSITDSQPMLSLEEEDAAMAIAVADGAVSGRLALGDEPLAAMHYWSDKDSDLAFSRRSAAVIFGQNGTSATWVVVVDLLDQQVTAVVPAAKW